MSERRRPRLAGVIAIGFISLLTLAILASLSLDNGEDVAVQITGASDVQQLLGGIEQHGSELGSGDAPVTIEVLNDMQCPACVDFQLDTIGALIADEVRNGDVLLQYRHYALGERNLEVAFLGATAAGEQDREWQYIQLFFINQGEARPTVTQEVLDRVASGVLELDTGRWREDFNSDAVREQVDADAEVTAQLKLTAEPAVIVDGPAGSKTLEDTPSVDQIREAIAEVGG